MARQDIKMTVPAGEPAVAAAPDSVPVAAGDVLGRGVVIAQRSSGDYGREILGDPRVLGEHEDDDGLSSDDFSDDDLSSVDFSDDEDDDYTDDEYVDSDSEFEDDGQPPDAGHAAAAAARVIFLERPTRCASVQNTIGFMRLAAQDAAPGKDGSGGEILVHYQYTRFSRSQSGDATAVDTHVLGPKVCSVRFHVPPHAAASAPASSLGLAGASLAYLIYPARFRKELRELWYGLVAVAPVRVPPRATRLVVTVDVGILRPGDCTSERMMSVCAAMEDVACEREKRPAEVDVGMELHLPAPLASEEEDDVRMTKRRRVAGEEEDCPICWEALEEGGLAAWPRCSHVFHGRCLEEHLVRGREECPMCRTELKVYTFN